MLAAELMIENLGDSGLPIHVGAREDRGGIRAEVWLPFLERLDRDEAIRAHHSGWSRRKPIGEFGLRPPRLHLVIPEEKLVRPHPWEDLEKIVHGLGGDERSTGPHRNAERMGPCPLLASDLVVIIPRAERVK